VLWSSVLAILCYYGAQESIYYFWVPVVNDLKPGSYPFWILVIARGVVTFSRFLGAVLMFWGVPPRIVSFVCAVCSVVTAILTMLLSPAAAALSMLLLTLFFEAPLFPIIFTMGLRNQGWHTKPPRPSQRAFAALGGGRASSGQSTSHTPETRATPSGSRSFCSAC
jgi:fucose permease